MGQVLHRRNNAFFRALGDRQVKVPKPRKRAMVHHRWVCVRPVAFTKNGKGDASKCPVARLVSFDQERHPPPSYDYAPYASPDYQGEYRMGMGLAPMKTEDWIEIDEEYESDIQLRRDLLTEKRDIVIRSMPEATDANREMLELLVDHLPKQFPARFQHTVHNELINLATGHVFDLNDPNLDPLEAASLLVQVQLLEALDVTTGIQEDLCLMLPDAQGELRFVSGAVLFPQRWSLMEKIGMNMHRIHTPVPLFEQEIERPVAAFMNRLEVGRPFWRCNWTISDNPEKFQPLAEDDIQQVNAGVNLNDSWLQQPVTAENAGDRLCTRMERETLSRFPRTKAVLFTIRTHMKPLNRFRVQPDKAWQLANALRNLHPAITQYKTIAAFRQQALDFLDSCSPKLPP